MTIFVLYISYRLFILIKSLTFVIFFYVADKEGEKLTVKSNHDLVRLEDWLDEEKSLKIFVKSKFGTSFPICWEHLSRKQLKS